MRLYLGGIIMAELSTTYTDAKNVRHNVQHITIPKDDKSEKDQLARELYEALMQKRVSKLPN